MDAELKYDKHVARAAAKGLEAVLELRRLTGSFGSNSTAAVHVYGCPDGGLRLERVDARLQGQTRQAHKQDSKDRSTGYRRNISHSGNERSRSGGPHS